MKTDDLIKLLATGVAPVQAHAARRRFQQALPLGGLGALAIVVLVFGVRHDLAQVALTSMFWVKLAFPLALAIPALLLLLRLSHPGVRLGALWMGLVWPFVAMALLAGVVLADAPTGERLPLLLGSTWKTCALNIALVSAPVFVGVVWAVKGLAPTRLALTGACAGLLAGAAGCLAYALRCTEMSAPFIAVWNTLGMLIPTLVGAWLGPRILRW